MLNKLEEKVLILARRRPPGMFFFRRKFTFRNFGDELSPVLVAAILRKKCPSLAWDLRRKNQKVLAIGSIMHFADDGDVIWGTGVNGKVPVNAHRFTRLDVRSVRGPRTKEFLRGFGIESPEVFGDPALLAPRFLKKPTPDKNLKEFIVIPHYHDYSAFEGVENIVSPLQPYTRVLDQIVSAKKVISSSLHGVILAEAFGIPAVLVLPNLDNRKLFKYLDYYEGTLRRNVDIASNFDEAFRMKGSLLPPEFSVSKLEHSFPTDFWQRSRD